MSSVAQAIRFREVPKGRTIIWFLVIGELVIFGGGIASYLLNFVRHEAIWGALGNMATFWAGALNTIILLTSSVCIVMAHKYASEKNLQKMKMFMWLTILCGALFLVFKGIEWIPKISADLTMGTNPTLMGLGVGHTFWGYYYFLTGMHGVHVVLGMLAIFFVMISVGKGKNLHRVEMAGIYWHFVDIIWIFLFPLFYISNA